MDESGNTPPVKKIGHKLTLSSRKYGIAHGQPHLFSPKHLKFLEVYAATLDVKQALKDSGMTLWQVRKSPYLQEEVKYINESAHFKHRSKVTVGDHFRLMRKFERMMDNTNSEKIKSSAMATLARMSEAGMKVAGEFAENADTGGVMGVQVVLNIGTPAEPSVSAEVVDVQPE